MKLKLTLPWPAAELWPNSHQHWAVRNRAAQEAKGWAYAETLYSLYSLGPYEYKHDGHYIPIRYTFHAPRATRRYDDDGATGACKWYRDGIAQALRIDDMWFAMQAPVRGEAGGRGCVVVEIGA